MFNKLFFVVLTAALFGAAANETAAQKLRNGGKPKLVQEIAGLTEAACVKFAPDVQICKGKPTENEDGDGRFIIRRGGEKFAELLGSINASGGATDGFQVFYGDLDNNKSKELVVVDFESQGNGLGVKFYSISIFPDFEKSKASVPVSFSVEEFGANGNFIYDAKTKETLILLTKWGGVQIKDPKRGEGLYFTGRFLRYKNGKLAPAAAKPILARRYLNSFERERYRTENDARAPYLWLQSADTLKLKTDPAFDKNFASSENGIIERLETVVETTGAGDERREVKITQLVVRLDSGARKIIVLSKNPFADLPSDAGKILFPDFGFLPQKTLLPGSVSLLDSMDKVENRRVQINTYRLDAESTPDYYVWFVEK